MERKAIVATLEKWISQLHDRDQIIEGIIYGSVLRQRDFDEASDVDVVLVMRDPALLSRTDLELLQFKLAHALDVVVCTPEQLRAFSPCHRQSNTLLTLARTNPQSFLGSQLQTSPFIADEFQRFWMWHTCLRRTEVFLRHPEGGSYQDRLRKVAAMALATAERGHLQLAPDERLLDFLPSTTPPWWLTAESASRFACANLVAASAPLKEITSQIIPANEAWLIRQFWPHRERLATIARFDELIEFLVSDGRELELKINEARS